MGPRVVGIEKDGLEKVLVHVTTAVKTTGRKEFSSEWSRESSTVLIRQRIQQVCNSAGFHFCLLTFAF
jgi:hypothetical protein